MKANGKRDLAKEQFWRKAIERFAKSGKSRVQFCKDENLKSDNLVYWSKAISQRDAAAKQSEVRSAQDEPGLFIPLSLAGQDKLEVGQGNQVIAEIVISGNSLFLFDSVKLPALRNIFQALKETTH